MRSISIIHTSDPHFKPKQEDNKEIAKRIGEISGMCSSIFARTNDIIVPVFSGDIGDNAETSELDNFTNTIIRSGLYQFGCLTTPGNHDACALGNEVSIFRFNGDNVSHFQNMQFSMAQRVAEMQSAHYNGEFVEVRRHEFEHFFKSKAFIKMSFPQRKTAFTVDFRKQRVLFCLLDTNPQLTTGSVQFARGEIGSKQMGLVERITKSAEYAGYVKIFVMHHHPVFHNYFLKLADADKFLDLIWDNAMVLFGHKHKFNIWSHGCGYLVAASGLVNNNHVTHIRIDCSKDKPQVLLPKSGSPEEVLNGDM